MRPTRLGPPAVTPAHVRRLSAPAEAGTTVQRVAVPLVPAARVAPRQIDLVGPRLVALQLENEQLRAELAQLRIG